MAVAKSTPYATAPFTFAAISSTISSVAAIPSHVVADRSRPPLQPYAPDILTDSWRSSEVGVVGVPGGRMKACAL